MTLRVRTIAWTAGAILLVGGLVVVFDVMIVTDEERVGELVDAVTGDVTTERIDRALSFCDPERQRVRVTALGQSASYDDADELSARAHSSLSRISGDTIRALSSSIDVDDDRAEVAIRALSDRGLVNARFSLRKHGDDWLLSEVYVSR